jgi:hypothetical protein
MDQERRRREREETTLRIWASKDWRREREEGE